MSKDKLKAKPAKKQPHEMGDTYACEKCGKENPHGYPCECGWVLHDSVKTQAFPKDSQSR